MKNKKETTSSSLPTLHRRVNATTVKTSPHEEAIMMANNHSSMGKFDAGNKRFDIFFFWEGISNRRRDCNYPPERK